MVVRCVETAAFFGAYLFFRFRTHQAKQAMRRGGPATPNALLFPAYDTATKAMAVVCFCYVWVAFAQEYCSLQYPGGDAWQSQLADVAWSTLVLFPSNWLEAFVPVMFILGSLGRRAFSQVRGRKCRH